MWIVCWEIMRVTCITSYPMLWRITASIRGHSPSPMADVCALSDSAVSNVKQNVPAHSLSPPPKISVMDMEPAIHLAPMRAPASALQAILVLTTLIALHAKIANSQLQNRLIMVQAQVGRVSNASSVPVVASARDTEHALVGQRAMVPAPVRPGSQARTAV
jgi:hypothetical protein